MYLIHEKKQQDGRWEVAWTWLPFFLAADRELHRFVDKRMTEKFKGEMLDPLPRPGQQLDLMQRMHQCVIDLILEKHPIPGLRAYLEGIIHVQPEKKEETDGVATQN